jgi:hypothetical protein
LNNPRANLGHITMAAGGILLALSTFLSWLTEQSAWETFSALDVIIFFGALATAAIAAAHITGAAANQPLLRGELPNWIGLIPATLAIALVLEFVFGPAESKFGAWLGFIASLAIIAGLLLRERPDLAAKVNEATAGIGSGGQPGAPGAPGGYAGSPAAGAPQAGTAGAPAAPAPAPAAQPAPAAEPQQPATAPQPAAPTPAAQPAQPESSGPAPGWYPDPQGQKRLRYWDGGRWTEQTAD